MALKYKLQLPYRQEQTHYRNSCRRVTQSDTSATDGHFSSIRLFLSNQLFAFYEATEVFQELDVLLMLHGSAELHQLIGKRVVHSPVGQEVHEVVVEGLEHKQNPQDKEGSSEITCMVSKRQ